MAAPPHKHKHACARHAAHVDESSDSDIDMLLRPVDAMRRSGTNSLSSHTSSKSTSVIAAMKPKKSVRASSPSGRPLHSATKYHRRVPAAPAAPPPVTADTPVQPSEESIEITQLKAIAARHRAEAARRKAEADRHKAEAAHHGDIAASTEKLIADMAERRHHRLVVLS